VTLLLGPKGGGVALAASTVDLSVGGARVRGDLALAPGDHVGLILFKGPGVIVPSRVVWVGPGASAGETHAGLEFLTPLAAVS
jgi:hypothetical protein